MLNDKLESAGLDNKMQDFDSVASEYEKAVPEIPIQYISLIVNTFRIKKTDYIIDLGCGTGNLAIKLHSISDFVEGLDKSYQMIQIAKKNDKKNFISWQCISVENYDFQPNKYSLIHSFESFHLFPNHLDLIKRLNLSLKTGGHICIGWCQYNWEDILKFEIIKVFKSFGITWGEWGFQSCSDFGHIVNKYKSDLLPLQSKSITIDTISNIYNIAYYLSVINKSTRLESSQKSKLRSTLEKSFYSIIGSDSIEGKSKYFISYVTKRS